jgi:hypothetical protein
MPGAARAHAPRVNFHGGCVPLHPISSTFGYGSSTQVSVPLKSVMRCRAMSEARAPRADGGEAARVR